VLLNNFPLPAEPTLGILDAQSSAYHTGTILRLNAELLREAGEANDVSVVDFMRIFAAYGSTNFVDERYWHIARAPLAQKALVPLGTEYGKFVRALRGKAKKCLVLDADNTLWGGIVGEDGLAGIKLGPTYPGSAFVALQREILNLHDRGVILALCSKNNEADVLEVLRDHPDSLLKEEHFSARRINWDDKVTNLRRIAAELNIGLDSMVFVDDNPFEAEFVREQLPEVAVLALPPNAFASYRSLLSRPGYFDALTFTAEDRRKNAMYAENRQRQALEAESGSRSKWRSRRPRRSTFRASRSSRRRRTSSISPPSATPKARSARSPLRRTPTSSRSRCATASPTSAWSAWEFCATTARKPRSTASC
jgi:HAD superfamily phosphatase (TIGR01681 family)